MGLFGSIKSMLSGGEPRLDVTKRFELLREAVSGTMSSFYVARDIKSRKTVGLKLIDVDKTNAVEARFQGLNKPPEGEMAVKFDHPNIVKTLEYGITTKNEDKRLSGRRLQLLKQAAEALAYVHKQGYIHRDVCPRNFVATRDCASLKLIDFGLTVPNTPAFTQPGNRTGTANYMAPEVVRRRKTSPALDVFAFGVTAYETCALELPWPRGDSGLAAMSHGVEKPADIRKYMPNINQQFADAIYACLQPEPDNRPTMEGFLKMIKDVRREDVA
jgi:eukaryotic-like serine/threonine-protein kinase